MRGAAYTARETIMQSAPEADRHALDSLPTEAVPHCLLHARPTGVAGGRCPERPAAER